MIKRLLRLCDVIEQTGLSRSSIYAKISEGTFPRTVPIGDRAVAWVEEEGQAWILDQIDKRKTLGAAA
jgi:prophage regulatory protein